MNKLKQDSHNLFDGIIYFIKTCYRFNKKYVLLLFLVQLISTFLSLMNIIFSKIIIDAIFSNMNQKYSIKIVLIYSFSVLILSIIKNKIDSKILVEKMITFKHFQKMISNKTMNIPLEYLEHKDFLDLKTKSDQFIYGNGQGFAAIMEQGVNLIGKIFLLLTLIGILLTLNAYIIIVIISLIILNSLINFKFQKINIDLNIEKSVEERRSLYFSTLFSDPISSKEIKSFNLINFFTNKYGDQLDNMLFFYRKMSKNNYKFSSILTFISSLQSFIVYMYMIYRAFINSISVGDFSMYLSTITTFTSTLNSVLSDIIAISQYSKYYEYFIQFLAIENSFEEKKYKLDIIHSNKYIFEFKNVYFRYPYQKNYALKNISTTIKSDTTISIVGKNGAGKSTFIKLLLGLYKPSKGKILLNGINIHDIDYNSYINLFSVVFQDFRLFSLSIKENIVLNNELDSSKLNYVLKESKIFDKIDSLNAKEDTYLYRDFYGDGYIPSGGEAQKLAIARALYKHSEIVILDEASSALDAESEYNFNKNLHKIFESKIRIFISHRLSFSKIADHILYFDNGLLCEQGNHHQLMRIDGCYHKLYNIQAKGYND